MSMKITPKDYLTKENVRNKESAQLFRDILQHAMGDDWDVLTGHHILYERDGDVETEGEIPSADTLIFDHDIMGAVFGPQALSIMQELAAIPAEMREAWLGEIYEGFRHVTEVEAA